MRVLVLVLSVRGNECLSSERSLASCQGRPGIIYDRAPDWLIQVIQVIWMRPQAPDVTAERSLDTKLRWSLI